MRFHPSLLTLALIGLAVGLHGQGAPAAVVAPPSPAVAYQGRLTEAGLPVTGTRSFTFSILDSQSNELWNSGPQDVAVNNGLYAVELGGTGMPAIPTTLLGTPNLKLHLAINGVALTPDTDLVPTLQARSAFEFSGPLAGDVGGTQNATVVLRLNGVPLDGTTAPTSGQALVFNGSSWAPATVTGIPGPQGPIGATGLTGAPGPLGPIGPVGAMGPMGPIGTTGATGPQGLPGVNGRTVLNGIGAPGVTLGVDGDFYLDTAASVFYGPKGAITAGTWPATGTSLVGPVGATGAMGPIGPMGATGPQGPVGPMGATGLQGPTGATGATGPQGFVGPTGATGLQGPAGLTGATGATGPQGPAGPPVSFKGAWNSTVTYAIGDTASENGASYIARTANLAIDPATDVSGSGGNWALLAAAGATGPTGATGLMGATGATGPAGPMGATGTAATVGVGTTTTGASGTSASVTNSGTSSAAVLNFTIPRGAAGVSPTTNYNRATLSSNASIPPNSLTDVLFNSFSGPMSSATWSGGVFTVPTSGFYSICCFISTTTSGGWPSAYLYLNGTLIQTDYSNSDSTVTNVWAGLNYMGPLALGDRIEVKVMDAGGFTVTPASYIVIAGY